MAHFLRHEPCPKCGSRDNLARYSDGSAWCFGCSYYVPGTHKGAIEAPEPAKKGPVDLTSTLPSHYLNELLKRGLNESEVGHFKYSPSWDRLVFTHGDFSEARAFDGRKPKTISHGQKTLLVMGEGTPVVLVEDILSAIRVGRVTSAVSLFGSHIPKDWIPLLTRLSREYILWLDEDKYAESLKQARMLRTLGLNATVVRTPEDPKAYDVSTIRKVLDTN